MQLFHREEVVESKLKLVDLAGSERQKATAAQGKLLQEANAINTDLTSLRRMVDALVKKASGTQPVFVPVRERELTKVLSGMFRQLLLGFDSIFQFFRVSVNEFVLDE